MATETISYLVSAMVLISTYLYGQGTRPKIYRWSGIFGMLTAATWIFYAKCLGDAGAGMVLLNILLCAMHSWNTHKQWKCDKCYNRN